MTEPLITDKLFSLIDSMDYHNGGMTWDQLKQIRDLLKSQLDQEEEGMSYFNYAQLDVRANWCYQRRETVYDYKKQIVTLLKDFPSRVAFN